MKRRLLSLLFSVVALFCVEQVYAVLPNGADAQDWTLTDINGQSYNLFSLLNQGKTVYIDFSATWCGPCWNYHNSGALEGLYNDYGPSGSNEVMVFFIEADLSTNLACLYGPSGCVGGTQGNWVAGTPYPIIDLNSSTSYVASNYAITYYPTIYAICPQTKKVYESGQKPTLGQYSYVSSCALDYLVDNVVNVTCNGAKTGSISISTEQGASPFSYKWSNGATTQDIFGLAAGSYSVTVTDKNGVSVQSSTIDVDQPDPIDVASNIQDEGCEGDFGGSIEVDASGGTPGYTYLWNNGKNTPTITGLAAGNYSVVVTDGNGCKKTSNYSVDANPLPEAYAGEDELLNCIHPQLELEGDGETGGDITYLWTTPNGNIVSGANSLNPVVDKAGTYELLVTNTSTGCKRNDSAKISADFTTTKSDAGTDGNVNCQNLQIVLDGSKSSAGTNILYDWITSDGNIVSGGKTNKATVNKGGTYTLLVTHKISGCTSEDQSVVVQNTSAPVSVIQQPGQINCSNSTLNVDGTGSTSGNDITYFWFSNGGNIISGGNTNTATVNAAGEYFLVVNNTKSLCTDTSSVIVTADANVPMAIAGQGGEINCNVATITLNGSQSSQGSNITVLWTTQDGNILSGANTYTPTVNAKGTYVIAVTNTSNNCTSYSSVVITEDQLSKVPDAIYNFSSALLVVNFQDASTGVPTTYLWDFGDGTTSTEKDPSHVYAADGTYTVCLTTTNACGTDQLCQPIIVSSNSSIPNISNVGITNATCKGGSNGCIDITVINGVAPYTYTWSNGLTTEDPCNMPAGTYMVTVTDTNGTSTVSGLITISELYYININNAFTTTPDCNAENGAIALDINSNGGQLSYTWSHDSQLNSAVAENLPEGTYTVIITDQNGCTSEKQIELLDKGQRVAVQVSDPLCFGDSNGLIDLTVTSGVAPYTYLWDNGSTSEDLSNLPQGTYKCDVTDASGCIKTVELNVTAPDQIASQMDVKKSDKGKDNGSITVNPLGGTAPYTYLWNNGSSSQTIENLAPGTYSVIITDGNGCAREFTALIEEAVSTITLNILSSVNVYPNPTSGHFWLEAKFTENTTGNISVVDLLGRKVFDKQFEGQEIKTLIDLNETVSGTFFLILSADNGQHIEKVNIVK